MGASPVSGHVSMAGGGESERRVSEVIVQEGVDSE